MKTFRSGLTSLLALPLAACGAGTVVPPARPIAPPPGPPASAFMKQGPLMGADARSGYSMRGWYMPTRIARNASLMR